MERSQNTFNEGLNTDMSVFVLKDTMMRYNQNTRLISKDGSDYVVSNLKGNEVSFQLSTGFQPVASQEFNQVLYILSWNPTTKALEAGSYPSPGSPQLLYRPLTNLEGGPADAGLGLSDIFRTTAFDLQTYPIVQKLEIQPDYDGSVNLCFTMKGKTPRIINSKFKVDTSSGTLILSETADRVSSSNSNVYSLTSILEETSLIVYSNTIPTINFGSILDGGKVKPGNYIYVFRYMTEDFNETNIVGQSSVCQVSFGINSNNQQGGNQLEETTKQVKLNLSNIDTDFAYIKVFAVYHTGQTTSFKQYLEFNRPIPITGATMEFVHNGFESLTEVDESRVNIKYSTIAAANASTQVGGFYFLGGVLTNSFNNTKFKNYAALINPAFKIHNLVSGQYHGYGDPANVYNFLGYTGEESYPIGVCFVMNDSSISPVYPIFGKNLQSTFAQLRGLVTMPHTGTNPLFTGGNIQVKHLEMTMNLKSLFDDTAPDAIVKNSIGFFFVRGNKRPQIITQGIILPTLKVWAQDKEWDSFTHDSAGADIYYAKSTLIPNTAFFKHVPIVDRMVEAYHYRGPGANTGSNVIESNGVLDRWMPIRIRDMKEGDNTKHGILRSNGNTGAVSADLLHWAFLSGDSFVKEANVNTNLLGREANLRYRFINKIESRVKGELAPLFEPPSLSQTGLHYDIYAHQSIANDIRYEIEKLTYVGQGIQNADEFTARIRQLFFYDRVSDETNRSFFVNQHFDSYLGLKIKNGEASSIIPGINTPIGNNSPAGLSPVSGVDGWATTFGCRYDNFEKNVITAYLINIYGSPIMPIAEDLFPTIDEVQYSQCSPRFSWASLQSQASNTSYKIPVFGGDCYISKVNRKLNKSPYTDKLTNVSVERDVRDNIDSGILVTWYQESDENLQLRQSAIEDASESERRSFFPYQSQGDYLKSRTTRVHETKQYSQGYGVTEASQAHFTQSSIAPFTETEFFSRVQHSERHIPNAFKNGYRSFIGSNYKDYDSSCGRIIALLNHRGKLMIIFEHGVGITEVEQRIQTGSDAAGAIYVEPSGILPPTLQYFSREIGCQDHLSIVQTPSSVYAVDRAKNRIWQIRETMNVITDFGLSSFLRQNPPLNPRSGYDMEFNEVLFTTDNWTLCFKEGVEKFTSFYSSKPGFYMRRANNMYSTPGTLPATSGQFWIHNVDNFSFYGEEKDVIVEFVMNSNITLTKVLDYLQIHSNNVPPLSIETYTFNQISDNDNTINMGRINQYGKIDNDVDPITEELKIFYRDKKFVVQVPPITIYEPGDSADPWGEEARLRNKYFVVRLTYRTDKLLELFSVISSYRVSHS